MLNLVRIPWYRRLKDQSIYINETFKGYHCMILHLNQQYINNKCASTYSETTFFKSNAIKAIQTDGLVQDCSNSIANALGLLQSCTKPSKQLFSLPVECKSTSHDKISHKCICYTRFVGEWACGLHDVFPHDTASGLVQVRGTSCVVCNNLLFFHSFNNLTHCGPVTPYGDIELGQHWPRQWLVA